MAFPIPLNFEIPHLFNNRRVSITLYSGLTVLVGPNGSGKTQVLKALKLQLQNYSGSRKIRYLSAGRLAALEFYRSNQNGNTGRINPEDASLGDYSL